jgi:ATP-dependent RNA helicase RhlE
MNPTSFEELGLSAPIVRALEKLTIITPTEIQTKTIPEGLAGRDLVASAETGSGKTAAFLLPIIEQMKSSSGLTTPRALVLAPTRELALQIETIAKSYGAPYKLQTAALVGGESVTRQLKALHRRPQVIIATPGRLNDLLQRNALSLGQIEVFVLDEADRMLDMGFLPQVRKIMNRLPSKRQTMLFSATLSREVIHLAREITRNPVNVEAARPTPTVATLTQSAYSVLAHAKVPLLLRLLSDDSEGSFLIFTETKRGAEKVARVLAANRHGVETIHSDRNQSQRNRALASFKSGAVRVLVATDVAARGIDVDDISHVINYDVPSSPEGYLHRVGRTARAGREGRALTLVSPEEEFALSMIERSTGLTINRSRLSGFSDGRTDQQISLASEIGRLRGQSSRSFRPRRASR